MDVQMPELNGWEATRQIRSFEAENGGHIPIVAMTASVFLADINICLEVGMDGHVGKPLDLKDVLLKMREYLS
jgi:CheY-like chemotaxis protein